MTDTDPLVPDEDPATSTSRGGSTAAEPLTPEHVTPGDLAAAARAVAFSGVRAGAWAAVTGVRAGRRAVDVVRHPDHAAQLADDLREAAAAITDALTGDDEEGASAHGRADRPRDGSPDSTPEHVAGHGTRPLRPVVRLSGRVPHVVHPAPGAAAVNPLHQAAQELLRQSRDVWTEDRGHPAYARIIEELAPDEARILVLLVREGPQASVDVRTGGVLGLVSSTLVAPQLTMIGARAGCRYVERVPSYLNNLQRLGLIWFPLDPLRDPAEYQVLEAQPDVLAARASVRRSRIVRRSIHLTPFGEDFCRDGLGLQPGGDDPRSIPKHANPGVA